MRTASVNYPGLGSLSPTTTTTVAVVYEDNSTTVRLGGYPFKDRTPPPPRSFSSSSASGDGGEAAAVTAAINDDFTKNEVLNTNLEAAIVEQVPGGGGVLSVEQEAGPQTRCQRACAENEVCHVIDDVTGGGGGGGGLTECKCRPGFGKRTNLPNATCESKCRHFDLIVNVVFLRNLISFLTHFTLSPDQRYLFIIIIIDTKIFIIFLLLESRMYQIEVFTTSESEETRIVRFSPRAVQQALESSFKSKIQVE